MKCTMKTVEKTAVILRMSESEAVVIRALLRSVGGLGHSGGAFGVGRARKIMDSAEKALADAGVRQLSGEMDLFDRVIYLTNRADDILVQEGVLSD